ncbi:MAG: hypothetical protein K6B68_10590, partial [Eubacterium sp.]|nr:hypothetical protein [Eubacterium sp.]
MKKKNLLLLILIMSFILSDIPAYAASSSITAYKSVITSVSSTSFGSISIKIKYSTNAYGYQLYYAKDKNFTKGKKQYHIKNPKNKIITKKGFSEDTIYYVKVRAFKYV